MENWTIIALGLIMGYFLYRYMNKKRKSLSNVDSGVSELKSNSEHTQKSSISDESSISDILANDKHKAKGQWDR